MKPLKAEFDWYREHQNELVEKYNGKVIVIKNGNVLGVYENDYDAWFETSKSEAAGSFFMIKCTPGNEQYTQTFHSRVAFA